MKNLRRLQPWLALAALTAATSVMGSATTISYSLTGTITNQLTNFPTSSPGQPCSGYTDFSGATGQTLGCLTLDAPEFDSSLGTLTSVELIVNWGGSTNLSVTNNGADTSTGHVETDVDLYLTDNTTAGNSLISGNPGGAGLPNLTLPIGCANLGSCYGGSTIYDDSGWQNLAGSGGTVDLQTLSNSVAEDKTFTSSNILDEFTGSGNLPLYAAVSTGTTLSYTGGNNSATQTTYMNVSGKVIYNYDAPSPTPEPATCGLFGSALVGLVVFRKRFKR